MAKCKRAECLKEAIAPWWYCSKECAPQAHLLGGRDTQYAKTAASTSKARGAGFGQSSISERCTEPFKRQRDKIQRSEKKYELRKNFISKETKSESKLKNGSDGATWTPSNERPEMTQEMQSLKPIIPEARSVEPSQILGRDASDSMSLIDKSNDALLELMNSVKVQSVQSKTLNPLLINSAANCAAQIQKLLRLKMDIVRKKGPTSG